MTAASTAVSAHSASGLNQRTAAEASAVALSAKNYAFLQRFIHAESGIVIEADKQYLLESRLLPILRKHQLESLDQLSERLSRADSKPLGKLVVEAMTTNETLFFRDSAVFDALRNYVLPNIMERSQGSRKARIWSAASSSGQEAYSVAMLLLELGHKSKDIEIVGTDLSNQILERARQGKYGQFEVNRGLPGAMLMRYFQRCGLEWQIKEEIRSMVRFENFDLRQDMQALGKFDLILCRNVLIYFDVATKRKIMQAIRERMLPGALLALGCSETVVNIYEGFERRPIGQSTFYGV